MFSDDAGRLWTASYTGGGSSSDRAIEFSCISDARESVRAIAADDTTILADVSDDTLRAWLRAAPRLGRLT